MVAEQLRKRHFLNCLNNLRASVLAPAFVESSETSEKSTEICSGGGLTSFPPKKVGGPKPHVGPCLKSGEPWSHLVPPVPPPLYITNNIFVYTASRL